MKCQIEKVPSHIKYLDQQITPLSREKSAWILNATEETPVVLIRKPTASNLSHRLLNPFIYRNIESVGTLDDLATLLDTPDDWKVRYNQVVADGDIIQDMNDFRNLNLYYRTSCSPRHCC